MVNQLLVTCPFQLWNIATFRANLMQSIITAFFLWYLVVQLISLAVLPLAFRLFPALADRGYGFAKALGMLLVGLVLWLGTSYGVLRNDLGGAWLALLLVAGLSVAAAWPMRSDWRNRLPDWRAVVWVEVVFLLSFAAWTWVRAHDPAINHTEQPMDLMFMSGIWTSPTFPPRDPWLAGYAISYYYLGYWLLMTVARLAGQAPEVAYNLGQACWFGLLMVGSFGVGYNLMAGKAVARLSAALSGLLTAVAVGLTGNLHVLVEWLYAQGVNVDGLARWANVNNFPTNAQVTNQWFIEAGWSWWWRSSRVISDSDLFGNHIEVIAEFPNFSYVLGDNHPHVLAMPFVLLVVGLTLNLFFWRTDIPAQTVAERKDELEYDTEREGLLSRLRSAWTDLLNAIPGRGLGLVVIVLAAGALVPLNTWDFPPYWVLLTAAALFVLAPQRGQTRALWSAALLAAIVLVGTVAFFFPYFLTAQSQAGGVVPNFFNPTRLPQFLLFWGHFLLAVGALMGLAWAELSPRPREIVISLLLVLGIPLIFLASTFAAAVGSDVGMAALQRMQLAPEFATYTDAVLSRWTARPWTFLLAGTMAALLLAILWRRWQEPMRAVDVRTTFALCMAAIALMLMFGPEFVFLRDNFGTRMNTIFKFYYQGWLLLAVAGSYAIVVALTAQRQIISAVLGSAALLLILAGMIYPVAGAYAKVRGFGSPTPTLDGIAYVGVDELAAVDWIRRNTDPEDIVLQGQGRSYRAADNRINAATGRATLLGWDGHESQWRGDAYGEMAAGRPEAIETIYRTGAPLVIRQTLETWGIDYVVVGPVERERYSLSPLDDARLLEVMDLVFEQGSVRIFRRRGE